MMARMSEEPRLLAANLSLEEFLGDIAINGNAYAGEEIFDMYPEAHWGQLPELDLISPVDGYSLKATVPNSCHEAFLVHNGELVGIFVERDTLILREEHRGHGLGQELVLVAYAQKPWCSPSNRLVSEAGAATLRKAHQLAVSAQQGVQRDGSSSDDSAR